MLLALCKSARFLYQFPRSREIYRETYKCAFRSSSVRIARCTYAGLFAIIWRVFFKNIGVEMAIDKDEWLKDRIQNLQSIKNKTEPQELLVLLYEKPDRSAQDEKNLAALIRLEKASVKLAKEKSAVFNALNAQKKAEVQAERKARTHELCNSAGLLILAGLVDTKTGTPTIDKAELLGALLGLAKVPKEDSRRGDWKRVGAALLAEKVES